MYSETTGATYWSQSRKKFVFVINFQTMRQLEMSRDEEKKEDCVSVLECVTR